MSRFSYKAYDPDGRLIRGAVSAESRETALDMLHKKGVIPLELATSFRDHVDTPWWKKEIWSGNGIATKSLAVLFRELATLVAADLPVDQALRIVALQPSIPSRLRDRLKIILNGIVEGQSLSACLDQQGSAFPDFVRASIRAGEKSGRLAEALSDLAAFLEHSTTVRDRLTTALIYPCILVVMALLAAGVIIFFLTPTVVPLLRDAGAELPAVVSALDLAQNFLSQNWAITLLTLVSLIGVCAIILRLPGPRRALGKTALGVPGIGRLIQDHQTALFTRTLATMTASDVSLVDGVRISGQVVQNPVFAEAAKQIGSDLEQGVTLHTAMAAAQCFPELAVRLVEIGETTGQLDAMLARAAGILETSVKNRIERVAVLLTPLLTIIIGLVIGWLILSVMSALFSVNTLVGI